MRYVPIRLASLTETWLIARFSFRQSPEASSGSARYHLNP
jgi:hypothetical protein